MMDCSYFHAHIDRQIDGELGYLEVAELRHHLDCCGACAAELAEAGKVRDALAAWSTVELAPPPGFSERVMAAIESESAATAARPRRRAVGGRLNEIDDFLGRVVLPGGRPMLVRNLIGWGLAAAAVLIGIERRHLRRSRELRPS
jgi:anti-sigma factor RsiW